MKSVGVDHERKAIGKELLEYVASNVKGYVYNADFEVHWGTVWLGK